MNEDSPFPWGRKYKGVIIKLVPPGYLLYCLEELKAPHAYMVGYRDLYLYLLEHEEELRSKMIAAQ